MVQSNLPSIKDILNNFDILQLDALIYEFLTQKFNRKGVTGGTLHNTACGILYTIASDYGVCLTCDLLPGTRKICKGVDNYLREKFGDHPKGKYPLLNPILEAMLKHATENEKFALLIAQRFCLRSQHYCNNRNNKNNNYIKIKDFKFIPNIDNPRAISIATSHDKNNPHLEHMERVVYCCCKVTQWTCVVHTAQKRFKKYYFNPNDALLQCKSGDMHYRAMLKIVKDLIKAINLDPKNYGTHSARSGGTTELFMIGKQALWIQNFGWWNNIGSVLIYIRPNNPDLQKLGVCAIEYQELRASEGEKIDIREKELAQLQIAVVQQDKKKKKGKTNKKLKQKVFFGGKSNSSIEPSKILNKRKGTQQMCYTMYSEHMYQKVAGVWQHNVNGGAQWTASPVGAVRTVVGHGRQFVGKNHGRFGNGFGLFNSPINTLPSTVGSIHGNVIGSRYAVVRQATVHRQVASKRVTPVIEKSVSTGWNKYKHLDNPYKLK